MPGTAKKLNAADLPRDVETCHEMITGLVDRLDQVEHRLQLLLRQRFGQSAERIDRAQLELFAKEILDSKSKAEAPDDADATVVRAHRRNGRRKLGRDLPRIRIEHDVPESERACSACGEMRTRIGEEISEQLEYEPAKLHVIEHARQKYACRACEGQIVTAEKPRQPIEKCLAGPGLLAQVAVSKYADHVPLNRLERIFKRHGVDLKRSTMCDWMRGCAEALEPLHKLMRDRVLASKVIHTDDTPVPVQDKGRGKTRTGRFWVYVGDGAHRYAVFDYTRTRSGAGPRQWLTGYEGYLQADAYAGYDELYASGRVQEVACWAHARRKFHEARLADPGRSHQALAWIKRLYAVEADAKGLDDDAERAQHRQTHAVPLLDDFQSWLEAQAREVLPKSVTADAIRYARSRWAAFTRYTTEGYLAIDNNLSERSIRCVAIGRKNWIFAGSDRGGRTAAVLFSMLASCRLHDVEPYAWMRDVLRRIPSIPIGELDELLPDRWAAHHATT